jgi:adenylate kinase family enzyme
VVSTEPAVTGLHRARRILVLGSPGAGKTVLSNFLGRHLGLEPIRLDDYFWKPGPARLPTNEWRALVVKLASRPAWVMDGTYEATLDLRIPAADALIFVRRSRWVCLWRVIGRRLLSRWRPHAESSPGHALTSFFLRYVIRFPTSIEPEVLRLISELAPGKPLIMLDGAREVARLIDRLECTTRSGGVPANGRPAA